MINLSAKFRQVSSETVFHEFQLMMSLAVCVSVEKKTANGQDAPDHGGSVGRPSWKPRADLQYTGHCFASHENGRIGTPIRETRTSRLLGLLGCSADASKDRLTAATNAEQGRVPQVGRS